MTLSLHFYFIDWLENLTTLPRAFPKGCTAKGGALHSLQLLHLSQQHRHHSQLCLVADGLYNEQPMKSDPADLLGDARVTSGHRRQAGQVTLLRLVSVL